MAVRIHEIVHKFPGLLSLVRGSADTIFDKMHAPDSRAPNSLIFVSNAEHLREAFKSSAQSWVVNKAIEPLVPASTVNVLLSPNVPLAMALIGKEFFPQTGYQKISAESIDPRAVISTSAKIAKNCVIGPGAVIGDRVEVGDGCVIGANCVLEAGVRVGPRTHVHPLVMISRECEIGADCIIKSHTVIGGDGYGYAQDESHIHHRIQHYGRVIIEDRVHIGSGVQIDRGTFIDSRIGEGTKIDNHCHFGHNIIIGKHTLITGGMIAAGSVTIGSHCVFGGRTTIKGHLSICDRVQIAGISGITKSITQPGSYGGLPLQEMSKEMRTRATLKEIPDMAKQLRRIFKHLGLSPESNT